MKPKDKKELPPSNGLGKKLDSGMKGSRQAQLQIAAKKSNADSLLRKF